MSSKQYEDLSQVSYAQCLKNMYLYSSMQSDLSSAPFRKINSQSSINHFQCRHATIQIIQGPEQHLILSSQSNQNMPFRIFHCAPNIEFACDDWTPTIVKPTSSFRPLDLIHLLKTLCALSWHHITMAHSLILFSRKLQQHTTVHKGAFQRIFPGKACVESDEATART